MTRAQQKLMPMLNAGWMREIAWPPGGVAELFRRFESIASDVVWLDSADGGTHLIGTGSALIGDDIAELERLRGDDAWVGWCSYEAGVRMLGLTANDMQGIPGSAWLRLDRWIVADERAKLVQLQTRTGEQFSLPNAPGQHETVPVTSRMRETDRQYRSHIAHCLDAITAGDAYVLCLTTAATAGPIEPIETYLHLRAAGAAHHGGFLRIGGVSVLAQSPEQFLHVTGRVARTEPIKGTRRRGAGDEDGHLARELHESEKERAENVMIVDLCRNDLARVSVTGSVRVSSLLRVETYASVHQLVSTVDGELLPGRTALDAIRALFPAGSMTGAPKQRAIELLADIEAAPRGIYSGCFGLLAGSPGTEHEYADLAMAIRCIVATPNATHIGVGGGITALSEPEEEVAEVHLKARALRAALVRATAD